MSIKVIVFDFDGTLIASNKVKHDSFFKLFPSDDFPPRLIAGVLSDFPEESRYVVLREMLKRKNGESNVESEVNALADRYDALAISGAKACETIAGAENVLKSLSETYKLYLSSTTPETSLKDIVMHRKWSGYFSDIFGYPKDKVSTLKEIMRRERVCPDEVLVIGDGETDRISAEEVGCKFYRVRENVNLENVLTVWKL